MKSLVLYLVVHSNLSFGKFQLYLKKILLLLMVCRYFSFSSKNTHVIGPLKNLLIVNPLTPRSDSQFSPPASTYFLLNKLQEFGGRSRQQLLFVMFEYSHYLFAG